MKQETFVANSSKGQKDRADWESHGIRNANKRKLHTKSPSPLLHIGRNVNDGSEDVICSEAP